MISELSYITHLSAEIKLFFQTIKLVPFGKKMCVCIVHLTLCPLTSNSWASCQVVLFSGQSSEWRTGSYYCKKCSFWENE